MEAAHQQKRPVPAGGDGRGQQRGGHRDHSSLRPCRWARRPGGWDSHSALPRMEGRGRPPHCPCQPALARPAQGRLRSGLEDSCSQD